MKRDSLYFLTLALRLFYSFRKEVLQYKYPYKEPGQPVDKRVADLVSRMTLEEKIKQLDMCWGKEVANMKGHEASSYSEEKIKNTVATTGFGSIHDFYPLTADIANSIQKYAIEKTRLGIPVLLVEEGLHGYSGSGSTSFPVPLQLVDMARPFLGA